jgi:hypothetical protein
MAPRTLVVQNQIRSTTSGIEYVDTLDLAFAETVVNEAFLNDPTQVSGTLIMDLNFLRTALRDIKGESPAYNWYDPAGTTAGLMTLSGARGAISNVQAFIGSDSDHDTTPDYTSTVFITQNASLEQTISELDAALASISGSQAGEIQKRILVRTGGQVAANTTVDLSSPGAGWNAYGDTMSWTSASDFVENISVFLNGVLQLTASGSSSDNDVYNVATPDQLAFEFAVKSNDVIQVWKFPPTAP